MRIKNVELANFKRFTELTISEIPESSKLVLIIGANGSGKSSLFDAFDGISKGESQRWRYTDYESDTYYKKDASKPTKTLVNLYPEQTIDISEFQVIKGKDIAKNFIGRSSIRIVPRLSNNATPADVRNDLDRPISYIENDVRFINDVFLYIQQINNALREPVFSGKQADTLQIFRENIEPLNDSLLNILGGDVNTTIQIAEFQDATPTSTAKLIFRKGESKINYDLLSHGEKQVIILLINFIVRQEYYRDSIIFIDEMDCHLNTSIQFNLIQEIVSRWIPDSSQLWTASHALGFIAYANKSEIASVLDFDSLDFDKPQTLTPIIKENLDIFEIAVPKKLLFDIMVGKKIVLCENRNDEYYNLLGIKDTIFVGVKDSRDLFLNIKRDSRYHSIRDRDFLSDKEIDRIRLLYPNHHILKYYNFENYLFHPENIAELNYEGFNVDDYRQEILKQKNSKSQYILTGINSARQSYEEFKTIDKLNFKDSNDIADDLMSDVFEKYYKYFDMKKHFNSFCLTRLNLSTEKLVQTTWFKKEISEILDLG